ncbi:MAG TPA: ATP-dependent zinc metalloprotease FtsH [Candidatus Pacebacteria bacterium]|nr:ATP-dependent zinc metalloprotease FtsH [Candidatus Paceibacterota bacterium]
MFIGLILWFFTRQKGGAMQALSFGDSKAKFIDPNDKNNRKTFSDIAGAKEAKQELMEVVDFLKHPKKYLEIGAEIPKGVLMSGAPGTGKTLLARAVAGEAGVPFFSISGSEFIEMFVGVGASRVRDLFKTAKKMSPSIIFIDEIDAIGRARGGGMGGGNDEREQTLNQILVEMDGFDKKNQVIVIAATNRPEILDRALLRPGRFDRRVTIDLPDKEDREKILEIHGKKKPFAEDVDLKIIAERTPGFSGADLYSTMNEGAILTASEGRKKVSQFDLVRSIEKVMLGPERKSHIFGDNEKLRTAYHEVGHALVSSVLDHADPVHKVTIISRGRAAGYTLHLPFDDRRMNTKKDFEADIAVSLGGYIAEKMIFGDVTTGPSNDLQVSTRIARDMVVKYGMSEKVGVLALEGGNSTLAGSGDGVEKASYSVKTAELVDEEVRRIMEEGFKTAKKILTKHEDALHNISEVLKDKEVLERDDYEALLKDNKIKIQTKEDRNKLFKIKKNKK